jgi:hypothetical protein
MVVKAAKQYAMMRYIGSRRRLRARTGSAIGRLRWAARLAGGPRGADLQGWTSFLTGACLQLQFAWRVASLRQLRRRAGQPVAPRPRR